ncbi:MAG: TonB-dependent receptor [Proteobacteria bacterium]|nr:TonB-dependent receptor [Pseudomonadota bacterium]
MKTTFSASALAIVIAAIQPGLAQAQDATIPPVPEATAAAAQDKTDSAPGPETDSAKAASGKGDLDGLLDMSLEEILAQEVTSVAKKSRRVGDSAAAVTVITQDDIRRSAARNVPDLLRMVPGMEVAEVQSSATSVSARGFTSRFAANLLVMIDGAAIYSTSISGMFWDQALIPLQDIERIEVIRGPGGTLWGSNSINGIVNIITKQSVDTQGLRLNASAGTFDYRTEASYGSQLTDTLSFRVYGDFRATNGLDSASGAVPNNSWKGGLGGVRFDVAPSENDSVVVLGEYSRGSFQERFQAVNLGPLGASYVTQIQQNRFASTHVLARWKHQVSTDFDFTLQAYFNNLFRTEFGATIDRDLFDLSGEGRWKIDHVNEINFGLSGRISRDRIGSTYSLSDPSGSNTDRWLTGYLQDEISIVPDKVRLTIGSKFEENNFTGFEIQPSVRLFVRTSPAFAAWASISRAVKTPLLINREMQANVTLIQNVPGFPIPVPVSATFNGTSKAQSEEVVAYEAGFRGNLSRTWTYDVALFYNDYSKLSTGDLVGTAPLFVPGYFLPVGVQLNYVVGNQGSGQSKGMEASLSGTLARWWKAELSYSYLDLTLNAKPGSYVLSGDGASPHHQVRLSSVMNLTDKFSTDASIHYVGEAQNHKRAAYTDLDIRATYRFNSQIEVSVVGSNLLKDRRLEYYQDTLPLELVYVPRSVFAEARVRF